MTNIIHLEMQISFLEDAVSAMDKSLANQQKKILELEETLHLLGQQVCEQRTRLDSASKSDFGRQQLPPHY